jgi:hypothetical protein
MEGIHFYSLPSFVDHNSFGCDLPFPACHMQAGEPAKTQKANY